jgi:hypothetical protein
MPLCSRRLEAAISLETWTPRFLESLALSPITIQQIAAKAEPSVVRRAVIAWFLKASSSAWKKNRVNGIEVCTIA